MTADPIIVATTRRIFQDLANPQTIHNISNQNWSEPLWQALVESGLPLAWCSEEKGGGGASMVDGFAIQRIVGEFATPIPLAETLLAGWLLEKVGISAPPGPMSVAPTNEGNSLILNDEGSLYGVVERVPFAREVEHLVTLCKSCDDIKVVLVQRSACGVAGETNVAGEPRDQVSFESVIPLHAASVPAGFTPFKLQLMGALMRATQMTGAIDTLLNMCISYAQERAAFGKAIAKFQVIQHNLAIMAGELSAALAATSAAEGAVSRDLDLGDEAFINVASAKIRVGEAANETSAMAHQLHGAIGFTKEHILHRYTHRLWCWRDEYGSEANWAVLLGENMANRGADEIWPSIAAA